VSQDAGPRSARFEELARLHMQNRRFLDAEAELRLLEEGVARHGLTLNEALGVLRGVAGDAGVASQAELDRSAVALLRTVADRQNRVSRRDFDRVASFYRQAARSGISPEDARERVKELMEENDLRPRRAGLLRSRRWYRMIGD
jgi:hypothetical protein